MAKIWGQLENAQLENKAGDYTGTVVGRAWWNTLTGKINVADGTNVRSLLRNDANCILGNHGTAANNIRLHRGASGVLQFVTGSDATAEGTLSTTLNQVSMRLESYATGSLPTAAAGNVGRTVWDTTTSTLKVDNGGTWISITGANTITNAMLRQSSGLSVLGRSANSTGDVADITGVDGQVLRVSGTALGFGTIVAAGIASDAVITAKILDANVTKAKLDADAKLTLCKAWANVNTVPANGTYSRSGTTITVTITGHAMTTGMYAKLDFTTGTATDGNYQITSLGSDTFTVTDAVSGATSGNVTRQNYIRASYGIDLAVTKGITDEGAVGYGSVNLTAGVVADAHYTVVGSLGSAGVIPIFRVHQDNASAFVDPTTTSFTFTTYSSAAALVDCKYLLIQIFGN